MAIKPLNYPIKLDDAYPCRGRDANGDEVHWDDLLAEGDVTGPAGPGAAHGDCFPDARVVRGADGLWVIWDPSVIRENAERVLGGPLESPAPPTPQEG